LFTAHSKVHLAICLVGTVNKVVLVFAVKFLPTDSGLILFPKHYFSHVADERTSN
jgi:hypothetical protein